jgi:hypothetical protein
MIDNVIATMRSLLLASSLLIPAVLFAQVSYAQDGVNKASGSSDSQLMGTTCRTGPWIKNLTSPSTLPCAAAQDVSKEMSRKTAQKLAETASSPEEHLKLAEYYSAEAIKLEAEGAQYKKAAVLYTSGPKNLVAPSAAARYRHYASELRQEAKKERMLAEDRVEMAKKAAKSSVPGH